ncbi:hypothetical protein FRC06_009732 [Ceratobasidium sp. 370]|nr:hypothetical protein FRC06_009732 [Ceratobasidium sp. 370]
MSDSVQPIVTEHITNNCGMQPPKPTERHPKFCFDDTLIAIQIEGTVFNIHKHQLLKSTVFSDMFAIAEESSDPQKVQEGLSLDHPIVMNNISVSDFECLMTVLYASRFSTHQPAPEASLVVPAFRLANMWNFEDLCIYLLPLAKRALNDVDKIVFAREFNVKGWLVPAYLRLCQRNEPPTTQEAHKLGVDALLFIYRLREERLALPWQTQPGCVNGVKRVHCGNCGGPLCVHSPGWDRSAVRQKVEAWVENECILPE